MQPVRANISIVSGRWRGRQDVVYGCPLNAFRGYKICSNSVRINRGTLESQLLAGLQESVLNPPVVEYALQKFEDEPR